MKSLKYYSWRIVLAIFILAILQLIFSVIFGIEVNQAEIGWALLSNLLIVLALTYAVVRSNGYGFKLESAIFLMFFGIYVFNTQIEAIFFQLQIPRSEVIRQILSGLLITFLFSPALVFIMDKIHISNTDVKSPIQPSVPILGYVWRFIVCDISYVFLYFLAGAIIYPYVKEFYTETAQMPAADKILLMQLFRGVVYVIVTLPVIRMFKGKRLETALMIGLQLSILGGIAPLLLPNPYMPEPIRLVHGFEVGISNFIYGAIIGFLFGRKTSKMVEK